ncbi:unnamed protein product [marine sediment metagenome]|uniref:Gfo/Idh/MocA-like oxidoreductase N-terminal domain-containing protein n=1 Tax=marine sediment metagenome TaxID=412755 RepID=X1GPL0_9ZZZZ
MEKPITAIVCGAGQRGRDAYGRYAENNKDKIQIIGVAEPNPIKRNNFMKVHKIPENRSYNLWKDILAEDKFADGINIVLNFIIYCCNINWTYFCSGNG